MTDETHHQTLMYPIYLRDFDNYVYRVESERLLSHGIEENDVEELTGWDSRGGGVELDWVNGEVIAKISTAQVDLDALLYALAEFGVRYGGKGEAAVPKVEDPEALYRWAVERVERFDESRRLKNRLRRLFRKGE